MNMARAKTLVPSRSGSGLHLRAPESSPRVAWVSACLCLVCSPFLTHLRTFCSLSCISDELIAKRGSIPIQLFDGALQYSAAESLTELFFPVDYEGTRTRGKLFVADGVDMLFVENLRMDPMVQRILTPAGLELLCSFFEPRQPEELDSDAMFNEDEEEALALLAVFELSLGKALNFVCLVFLFCLCNDCFAHCVELLDLILFHSYLFSLSFFLNSSGLERRH